MNIIDKFMKLKTWKKLGIGIALLTMFKYLTMGSIFLEVKAETSGTCEPYITNPITGLPEDISLSKTTDGTYITNLDPSELNMNNNKWQGWGDYYYKTGGIIVNNDIITDYEESNLANIGNNVETYSNYITRIEINDFNYNYEMGPIHPNTDYTIVLEVIGGSGTTISNIDAYTTSDFGITLQGRYMQYNYNNTINLSDYYSIKNARWTTCINTSGEVASDRAYLILKIHTNELLPEPSGGLYFKSISIGVNNINDMGQPLYQIGDNFDSNYKYLIKSNTTTNQINTKRLWLIMDGDVAIGNEDAELITGQLISNQIYEKCEPFDLACHVRNIQRGIENFGRNILYSLKTLFSYIFIPDFDFINDYIDETNQMLTEKYPDIQAFEDYIEYFNGRLNNLSRQTTISFPGVKWPFDNSNTYIIPAFTYDFSTIINDNRIAPYYTIGRIVIIAMISIWWGIYLINWLKSILHNTPKIDM